MEDTAQEFQEKYRALEKEVKEWGVFMHLRNDVDKFRKTMPLLFELRDEAMRDRHWRDLRNEVKDDFDESGEEFTLEKALSLNLLNHEEKILELTDNAKKQLKFEVSLVEIDQTWNEDKKSNLNIEKKKSKADNNEFFEITDTNNIMELIEDHGGRLGTMKSSPYYKEFDVKIDLWEYNIS